MPSGNKLQLHFERVNNTAVLEEFLRLYKTILPVVKYDDEDDESIQ